MHTAFKRNHIKLLSVGYIQYNLGTLVAPENVSVVFKRISVTNLCWWGCSKVLLFFAVWVLAYPRIEYWEELKRISLLWYGGRRKAIFSLHYSLQCGLFFILPRPCQKQCILWQDLRSAELLSLPQNANTPTTHTP